MRLKFLNLIFGSVTLKCEGIFPERIVNIANTSGIFIQNIKRESDTAITFSVSSKGKDMLLSESLPENISLTKVSSFGLPEFFKAGKRRIFLIASPFIIFFLLFLSTQFIWTVNIIDADSQTEERLLKELKELGVKRGALKFKIDQSEVKDKLLNKDDSLMWVWVDFKGSSAIVRYSLRTKPPILFDEDAAYSIYSKKAGTVTQIIATNGTVHIGVGDNITKGQLLIEGIMPKNEEETKYIHASGQVFATVWEEKKVPIPKKTEIRTPTGRKKQHLSINFLNFPINLFINSSNLYTNYDIIVSSRTLSFIPITFKKEDYIEVDVTYADSSIPALRKEHEENFKRALSDEGHIVRSMESYIEDKGDSVLLTIRVLCEEAVHEERRIYFGEDNSVTNS